MRALFAVCGHPFLRLALAIWKDLEAEDFKWPRVGLGFENRSSLEVNNPAGWVTGPSHQITAD